DAAALECTFRMINAETQLMYASDYPHWDFDLPSTIFDLPFLSERAKHNILGGTAARLFKLPPRNDKQRQNLQRFGNLAAGRRAEAGCGAIPPHQHGLLPSPLWGGAGGRGRAMWQCCARSHHPPPQPAPTELGLARVQHQ